MRIDLFFSRLVGSPDQPHQHPGELIRIANSNSQAPPGTTESGNLEVGPGLCVLEPPGGSHALGWTATPLYIQKNILHYLTCPSKVQACSLVLTPQASLEGRGRE